MGDIVLLGWVCEGGEEGEGEEGGGGILYIKTRGGGGGVSPAD